MITPLDIENKRFSKQMVNGYSVEEVDDFLDELSIDYEKIYKQVGEATKKASDMEEELKKYKNIENTLQNTLVMAQTTADEIKELAKQQADQIVKEAQGTAKQEVIEIEQSIVTKRKELEDLEKQIDVYKAKMESLLISQLELLKDMNKD